MRTIKTLKIALLSLLLLAAPVATPALAADATGIVTINIQAILSNSKAAKSAKTQIEAKRDEYQAELKKLEDSLRKEEQAIREQRSLLSPEAMEAKAKEFSGKMTAAQKSEQDKRERLAEAHNQALASIQDSLLKIVQDIIKTKGAKVVIPTNNLLFATPDLDITQEALTRLDKDLPSVKVNFTTSKK